MKYSTSPIAIAIFGLLVAFVLGISFYLGRRAKSAKGYYAAHGQIPWFVNGIAFAGDYLSAASFLGICGIIAFFGYDGFLYSIGYLAGWVVALLVIAEPIKRLGKFTFADALDSQFNSRSIKLMAAISTLIVSTFYLIPQMVGAGTLITPLLGYPYTYGVVGVGLIVILIVVTAGMVSTTWVQFIKGSLLVIFCSILTVMILARGLTTQPQNTPAYHEPATIQATEWEGYLKTNHLSRVDDSAPWGKTYTRVKDEAGTISIWRIVKPSGSTIETAFTPAQYKTTGKVKTTVDGKTEEKTVTIVNGLPQGHGEGQADFYPVDSVARLPDGRSTSTGPLGPLQLFAAVQQSTLYVWKTETLKDGEKTYSIFYPEMVSGSDVLVAGRATSPNFAAIRSASTDKGLWGITKATWSKLDLISLMLALFCGTAALPHILIRYYTVKDQASARKSTVVGIGAIGLFYILTLYLGVGAMTSGMMDPTNNNMSAPLLAKSFGEVMFACVSAIAFTTVLGTVSGLIIAASGAVAHDLINNLFKVNLDDQGTVRAGKIASVVIGFVAILLGIQFEQMNPTFLVGWAFNVAASANLPAIVMLLFWKGTTKSGIAASITVGLLSSLIWILNSTDAYTKIYHHPEWVSPVPFSQPGLVTIPLSFITLILVSLVTSKRSQHPAHAIAMEDAGK